MISIEKAAKKHADNFTTISDAPADVTGRDIHEYVQNAFKAGFEFANKWISVNDKLPAVGAQCLVKYADGQVSCAQKVSVGWLRDRLFGQEITHWRHIYN